MKRILILGSSGGNLYNLGGKDPKSLLEAVVRQVQSTTETEIAAIQFVAVDASLDFAKPTTAAHLWSWNGQEPVIIAEGTLKEIDKVAKEHDQKMADLIDSNQVDGLILMSADPAGTNKKAITAAIKHHIIAAGTGGTSMSNAQKMGLDVVAVSGTTGTTNETRAVSAMFALTKKWQIKYSPLIGGTDKNNNGASQNIWQNISLRGILMACLPAFITMAITLLISKIPGIPKSTNALFDIMLNGLPVIISAVAAKQISGLNDIAICAGVIAGLFSTKGGLIGGIICGIMAGILVSVIFKKCLQWHFPGTTANICAGSFAGLISGLTGYYLIAHLSAKLGDFLQFILNTAIAINPILAGAVAGFIIFPAILTGCYHAIFLPLIMLQMSKYGSSFLGAIDMCSLIMVATGINLANVLYPQKPSDRALAVPGLFINLLFGTYAESVYPFILSNKLEMIGTLICSTLAGCVVGLFNVSGTAYVPSFLGPAMSNNWLGFLLAMLTGIVSAFIMVLLINKLEKGKLS